MPSLNKVMLIGNVGRDPEVRYLDQGSAQAGQSTKVATFTLATTDRYRDRAGELRENTEWHNLVLWRQLADLAEKYIRRGSQIYVEGRIRTRSYNDQQGQKKFMTEIVADNVQLLGRREGDGAPAGQGYQGQAGGYQAPAGGYQAPAGFAPQSGHPAPSGPAQDGYRRREAAPAPQPVPAAPDFGASAPEDDLPF
ncbi:MAG: single-stranded DNA-binding protein [Bacteroidales bacterium]|nr:single-stranded DNA-binding protein [Bacteroidales bacterium]